MVDEKQSAQKKQVKLFWGILIIQLILLATHLGEFWPSSIYPMFSQAGRTWTRSMVQDVTTSDDTALWTVYQSPKNLVGTQFPIDEVGINQNDVANYIQKIEKWDQATQKNMRDLFSSKLEERKLLLYQVNGSLSDQNDVNLTYTPILLMEQNNTTLNPSLK